MDILDIFWRYDTLSDEYFPVPVSERPWIIVKIIITYCLGTVAAGAIVLAISSVLAILIGS